jgi:pimeloyl-ACP methyl ester carboxylesterase
LEAKIVSVLIRHDLDFPSPARAVTSASPVVFVHGSAGGLDSWDTIASLLAEEYEVWVFARRGYPPSDPHLGVKTFAHEVSDVEAVLAAVGRPAHLVGASHGATVALHSALQAHTEIRSLSLFEPPLFAAGRHLVPALERYRTLVAAGDFSGAATVFAEQVARIPATVLAGLAQTSDADRDQRELAGEAVGCMHDLEAMVADTPDMDRWTNIGLPVLLMQGGSSWAPIPETMDALATAMPWATRVTWPGQSHFATHTDPMSFVHALRQFLPKPPRPVS